MKRSYLLLPLLLVLGCSKTEQPVPENVEQGLAKNIPAIAEIYRNGTLVKRYRYNAGKPSAVEGPNSELTYFILEPSAWTISHDGGVKSVHEYRYTPDNVLLYDEWTRNDVPMYRRYYVYDKRTLVKMKTEAYPGYPYSGETVFTYSNPWAYSVSFWPVVDGIPTVVAPDEYHRWKTPFMEEKYDREWRLLSRDQYSLFIKAPDFNVPVIPTLDLIADRISIADLFFNRMSPPADQQPGLLLMKQDKFTNGQLYTSMTREKIILNKHGLPDAYVEVTRNASGQVIQTDSWRFVYVHP